jgi:RimJ/RimL family protein N-acetyltransferase
MPKMHPPPPTERLRFRRYGSGDLDAVMEMFDDDEARRWYPTKSQPAEAERWIEWNLANYDEFGVGLWAIEDRSTGIFVGDCGLTYQTVENDQLLEVGYHLLHRYRGRGYALESARSCVDFAVGRLRAPTVCSIVDPENESSIRVADAIHDCMRTFVNNDGNEWNLYWTDRPSTTDED